MPADNATVPMTMPTKYLPGSAPGNASSSALLTGPKDAAPQVNAKGMNLEGRAPSNSHFPTLSIASANPSDKAMYDTTKGTTAQGPIRTADATNGFCSQAPWDNPISVRQMSAPTRPIGMVKIHPSFLK